MTKKNVPPAKKIKKKREAPILLPTPPEVVDEEDVPMEISSRRNYEFAAASLPVDGRKEFLSGGLARHPVHAVHSTGADEHEYERDQRKQALCPPAGFKDRLGGIARINVTRRGGVLAVVLHVHCLFVCYAG
jgi:hypothetical protein